MIQTLNVDEMLSAEKLLQLDNGATTQEAWISIIICKDHAFKQNQQHI
jgi:hypothetical protein